MPRLGDEQEQKRPEQFVVRLPPGLREQIAALAASNGRSMNSEVVAALEKHIQGEDRFTELSDFIENHRDDIVALSDLFNLVEKLQRKVDELSEDLHPTFDRHD